MRTARFSRESRETQISIEVNLEGRGAYSLDCPIGFLSHMLDALARFSLIDIGGSVKGDLEVDGHHTVEDCAFALGSCLRLALGDMRGISRSGFSYFPMDEALVRCVLDFSGRPSCIVEGGLDLGPAGNFDRQLFREFWEGFARGALCTIQLDILRGDNGHHAFEAGFKAAARAIMAAVAVQERAGSSIPSTKGMIDAPGRAGETGLA